MKFNKKLHPSKKNAIKLKLCNFFLFLDQLHMKTGGKEGKSTSILFDDEIDTKPLKRKISKVPAATHALNYLNNFEQYFFKLWNCVFHILSEIYKVVLLQNRKKTSYSGLYTKKLFVNAIPSAKTSSQYFYKIDCKRNFKEYHTQFSMVPLKP